MKPLKVFAGLSLVFLIAGIARAGEVSVNGTTIPRSFTQLDSTQAVTEFREGGDPAIRLLPGSKRFGVCITSVDPVAVFDAEFPLSDTPSRFIVKTEDGREFGRCLVAALKSEGAGDRRRFTYCLRCEDVTTP